MQSEAIQTLQHYFSGENGTELHYFGNGIGAKEFANLYQFGERFVGDSLDMLIKSKRVSLIIEHFEFDCYRANHKGSQNKKEQARISRAEQKIAPTESGTLHHDQINGLSSYEFYVNNVCSNFKEHYARIPKYKKNLQAHGLISASEEVKTLFLIDDVSPLGTMTADEHGAMPVVLACCKEFLDLLSVSDYVDYVLACSSAGSNEYIWFIDRDEIKYYYKEIRDYASMQFLDFTPQVVGFKIIIPTTEQDK